jgi:ureidoglycolate lyase
MLKAVPLTAEGFAPFGQVIEAAGAGAAANQGRATRIPLALDLAADPRATRAAAAIYRIVPSTLPFAMGVVERHPLSAQLFFPNRAARFLVCTLASLRDGEPDLDSARAFIGHGGQGIVYRAGVWHGPLVALDAAGDFLMQMRECGGPEDCEERALAVPIRISECASEYGL